MTPKEVEVLLPGTRRRFKKGMPIIYQGEVPRDGYYIKKGVVKVYNLNSNGSEQILRFYIAGDFFPLPWLFSEVNSVFYFYEAIEMCELISVTRDDVANIITKNSELNKHIMKKAMRDKVALYLRITSLEQSRSADKLIFTLYYLMFMYGKNLGDNQYKINIRLTHSVIANLVGLTRETTATEINKFRRKEILNYDKKFYTINRSNLEKAMGDDSFKSLIA